MTRDARSETRSLQEGDHYLFNRHCEAFFAEAMTGDLTALHDGIL
jgi:hypothetical protein